MLEHLFTRRSGIGQSADEECNRLRRVRCEPDATRGASADGSQRASSTRTVSPDRAATLVLAVTPSFAIARAS